MSIRFTHLAGVGAAIALLISDQQAAAFTLDREASEPCCSPCPSMCGDWELGAHALYFTPIACPYAYASVFTQTPFPILLVNGQAELIPCRADWGFRVFGNYVDGCTFVGLSYEWFQVTTTRSVVAVAPQLVTIQGGQAAFGPGKATGQTGIEYQNVDVRLGTYLRQGCNLALYLYGNARWVDLSYRRTARVLFTDGRFEQVREKSQLEGGALGIGVGGEYDVWCGVGAFIDGSVLGVIGERSIKDVRYIQLNAGTITERQESYPSEVCVIPEIDFRIGINYTYACGCWKLVGEIGYEVDYFWHGSVFPDLVGFQLIDDTPARNFVPVCEDIGFSGLFFGARLIF